MRYVHVLVGSMTSAFLTAWLCDVQGDAHRALLALSSTIGALGGSWGYERWKRRAVPLV